MPTAEHERSDLGRELLGGETLEQTGQRHRDPCKTDLADGGRVAAEDSGELRTFPKTVVLRAPRVQRSDEEVELIVVRPLTPQSSVVVEAGDPELHRQGDGVVEEPEHSVAGRA